MARKRRWTRRLLYLMLEVGALSGVPMRPEQVEELTRLLNGTAVVAVSRREDGGDPPP